MFRHIVRNQIEKSINALLDIFGVDLLGEYGDTALRLVDECVEVVPFIGLAKLFEECSNAPDNAGSLQSFVALPLGPFVICVRAFKLTLRRYNGLLNVETLPREGRQAFLKMWSFGANSL